MQYNVFEFQGSLSTTIRKGETIQKAVERVMKKLQAVQETTFRDHLETHLEHVKEAHETARRSAR